MCPDVLHIAGGPHATLAYEEFIRENREFEVAFVGESERLIVEFCHRIEANVPYDDLNGLAYIGSGDKLHFSPSKPEEDLESLAFPRFESFYNTNPSKEPYHLLTSRGCPYSCTFCCVHAISGRKWRFRSPENIVAELEEAVGRYGIKEFEIDDDNFTLDIDRAKMFCNLLNRKKLGLRWFCPNGIRADRLDSELASLMAATGCHSVALGIESGDRDVLKMVRKGENLEDIERAVGYLKKAGIHTMGYFIIGLPGSTFETELETMRYEKRIGLDDSIYNLFLPYPETEAWKWVKQNGRFLRDYRCGYHFSDDNEFIFETKEFSIEDRMKVYLMTKNKEITVRGLDVKNIDKRYLKIEAKDVLIINLASFGGIYNDVKGIFPKTHITLLDIPNRNQYAIKDGTPASLAEIERTVIPENLVLRLRLAWRLSYKLRNKTFDIIILPRTIKHIIMALLLKSRLRIIYFPKGPGLARLSTFLMIKLIPGTLFYRTRLILWWISRCGGKMRYGLKQLKIRTLKRTLKLTILGIRINFLKYRQRHFLTSLKRIEGNLGVGEPRVLDLRAIADGMGIELGELIVIRDRAEREEYNVASVSYMESHYHRQFIKNRFIEPIRKIKGIGGTCFVVAIFGFSIIWMRMRRIIMTLFIRRT